MTIQDLINQYEHCEITLKPNKLLIPVSVIDLTEDGAKIWNEILDLVYSLDYVSKIERTASGGISYETLMPAFDITKSSNCLELTLLLIEGFWRIQIRSQEVLKDGNGSKGLSGKQAFTRFKKLCLKYGIDLKDYQITNGPEVKKTIPEPIIKLEDEMIADLEISNAHHIDFHNSYPSGLVNTHPEFREVVNYLYLKRKTDPNCKAILNYSVGYMHSLGGCNARWAHLAKDAITNNNERLMDIYNKLIENGNIVLAFNTDGIWYQGKIYHGDGEGPNLGEWHNDHQNCIIRFKSAGSYEFIEDGKYYPVVRGKTKLDRIKSRSEWVWGDIYNECEMLTFKSDAKGYIKFNYEKEVF